MGSSDSLIVETSDRVKTASSGLEMYDMNTFSCESKHLLMPLKICTWTATRTFNLGSREICYSRNAAGLKIDRKPALMLQLTNIPTMQTTESCSFQAGNYYNSDIYIRKQATATQLA